MILEAHAGIGIVGKEGRQASISADYSILRFMDLQRLILIHGRNFTIRSTVIAHILINQGLLMGTVQAVFILTFWNLPVACYDGLLMLGLSSIWIRLPLMAF
jgi:phospholipid-translocating ATPase